MQNFELLYFATPIIMGSVIIAQAHGIGIQTISHAAFGKKASSYVLFWGLIFAAIVFTALMYRWFIPNFKLGLSFKVLIGTLFVSQVLTAVFPVKGKNVDKLHMVFGSILALGMIVFMACLVFTTSINSSIRIIDGVLLLAIILSAITPRWTRQLSANHFFAHELVFFSFWHVAVLLTNSW